MLTPEIAAARRREVIIKPTHRALWYEDGVQELETLRERARSANARIYIGFDKHFNNGEKD